MARLGYTKGGFKRAMSDHHTPELGDGRGVGITDKVRNRYHIVSTMIDERIRARGVVLVKDGKLTEEGIRRGIKL